jgi:hypothetical protein
MMVLSIDSRIRRAVHDDDRLRLPSRPQELSGHISGGSEVAGYDRSNQQSNATSNQDSITQVNP